MKPETQSLYQAAIIFATEKHIEENQTIPGTDLPYVVHLSNVAMEILIASSFSTFDLDFAIQLALLHDTLEDTSTTFEQLKTAFGQEIAEGVKALSKDSEIPKDERMTDSLSRIKTQRKEVWAVKIADRITNLQKPPKHWTLEKKKEYQKQAIQILQTFEGANDYLENRLKQKIEEYKQYFD